MPTDRDPLVAPAPAEVALPRAPLIRVICQVRFPAVLAVSNAAFVAPFQEAIGDAYPILEQGYTQSLTVGPDGVAPSEKSVVYRFQGVNDGWRVSLGSDFVSLETTSYRSRQDFLSRLRQVIHALAEYIAPRQVQRVGLRYVDRLTGESLQHIGEFVRPEVRGILGTSLSADIRYSVHDSILSVPGSAIQLRARWGSIAPGTTIDPSAIEPLGEPSWILDFDMSSAERVSFNPESILTDANHYAERIYSVFRWAVTDAFLTHFGGKP